MHQGVFNEAIHSNSSWVWITVQIKRSCEPVKWFTFIKCSHIKSCFLHILIVVMRGSHTLSPKHEVDWHGNIYQERPFHAISMKICFFFSFFLSFPLLLLSLPSFLPFFFFFLFLKNRKTQVGKKLETSLSHKGHSDSSQLMRFLWTLGRWKYPAWRGHTCFHWAWM